MAGNESNEALKWLTNEYVEDALRKYRNDDKLKLQQMTIKPATDKGENYASVMKRILVEYEDKDCKQHKDRYLMKTTFADKDPAAHLLQHYGIYVREMDMYEEVLPKLTALVQQKLGDSRKMFAATVRVDRKHDSILFEDLSLEKYVVADRLKQLDLEHTHLVLEKLASFHAAGAVLNQQTPDFYVGKFDRCFFNKYTRAYTPLFSNMLKSLVVSLEGDKKLQQRYAPKLEGVIKRFMDYGERAMEIHSGDFATLCHGDLWTMNLMFNYEDQGKPKNVVFIDFQFSVFSSPAIDLHYLFTTSIQEDLFLHHQAELVHFYHQKLVAALDKIKYTGPVPSLFQFQQQFQAHAFYSVFSTLVIILYTGSVEFSIEKALAMDEDGAASRVAVYKDELYQKKLRILLPLLERKGLLDPM